MIVRTYRELKSLDTFEDRFQYLKLKGAVGRDTFGYDRYLNQRFYTSRQWRDLRHHIIARDMGCDLGVDGYDIHDKVIIHHMNPIMAEDIVHGNEDILNPDFLITTTQHTHNAIHYGSMSRTPNQLVERRPGDTDIW